MAKAAKSTKKKAARPKATAKKRPQRKKPATRRAKAEPTPYELQKQEEEKQGIKRPRGRQLTYKPEYAQAMIDFFDKEPWEDLDIDHFKNGDVSWTDKKRVCAKLPTLTDFAKHIGVCYKTLYNWFDEKSHLCQPDLLQALRTCEELRTNFLIQNGLAGMYPPGAFMFVAKNLTGMVDKIDVENKQKIVHIHMGHRKQSDAKE